MAKQEDPLNGEALIKEGCRRIRVARSYWDAHNNAACRGERDGRRPVSDHRALTLYNTLTKAQKEQIPQVLRVWLLYRSQKYFGAHRTFARKQVGAQSQIVAVLTDSFSDLEFSISARLPSC